MEILTLSGYISVEVPGSNKPVEGTLSSCIFDGLTLRVESGPHIRALHKLIADGQIASLTINLKEPEVDES